MHQVGQVNLDSYSRRVLPFFPARYLLRPGRRVGAASVVLSGGLFRPSQLPCRAMAVRSAQRAVPERRAL